MTFGCMGIGNTAKKSVRGYICLSPAKIEDHPHSRWGRGYSLLLDVHYNDVDEGKRAYAGPLRAILDPLLKGVKSHFLRLCPNAVRGYFALWGVYSSEYSRAFRALPAQPRPYLLAPEMWTHSGENSKFCLNTVSPCFIIVYSHFISMYL